MVKKKKSKENRLTLFQKIGLWFYDGIKRSSIIIASVVIFGFVSYSTILNREGFPSVASPIGLVTATYFVNDSNKVDEQVSQPLNELISSSPGVKEILSSSASNFATVQVQFDEGVDANSAMADIQKTANESNEIPDTANVQAKALSIDKLTNDGDDLLVSVVGQNNQSAQELYSTAGKAAEYLADNVESAERASPLVMFNTGVNPLSGKKVTEQTNFDYFGEASKQGESLQELEFNQTAIVGMRVKSGGDQLQFYDQTEVAVDSLNRQDFMQGYQAVISGDFATSIREQISSLERSLIEGILAVVLVCFLLISFRAGLVTALSMIAVLLATAGTLFLIGYSLNTITLFALILCLALIVDDMIIMVEALDKGRQLGLKKREIVSQALVKVARASTTGTLVTMLAFAPMIFIGGILGSFIRAIPITIIISLAISLLVSITLIPLFAHFLLGKTGKKSSSKRVNPINKAEDKISDFLSRVMLSIGGSTAKKTTAVAISLLVSFGAIVGSAYFFSQLSFNIFPETKDSDAILINATLPPGSTLEESQKVATKVNEITSESLNGLVERASYIQTGSTNGFRVTIELSSFKSRDLTSIEIAEKLESDLKQVQGAEVGVSQIGVGPPASNFGVRIYSEDVKKSSELAKDVEAYMASAQLKRPDGTTATFVNPAITGTDTVLRDKGQRYVAVTAGLSGDDTSALVLLGQNAISEKFPSSKVIESGLEADALQFELGQEEENQESFAAMLIAFPILLLVMYVLLAVQFKSFLQPFLIFSALPFSLFGVAAGLYLTDNPLSFFTMIGFFALIGISMNNTILLTDYANKARAQGYRPLRAMSEALHERFRPLLTTSTTSVLALLPLALADPFWESLAFTLIFGLVSSTILVVLVFPYYYLLFEWLRIGSKNIRRKVFKKKQ